MSVPTAHAKKMNLPIRVIAGIVGLLVIAVGITQIRSGVSELTGGASTAVTTMLAEIETAVTAANASTTTAALNREIVGLVMDESITTMEELAPKITDAGQRRDAAQAAGLAAQERANIVAKELGN